MKELLTQFTGKAFHPQSEEDFEIVGGEFKQNELVSIKAYHVGAKKARSVPAMNTLHACFKLVADNTNDPKLDTKQKVKFACKVALDYRYEDRVACRPDGTVVFEYRSFSFKTLEHMESVNLFDRAFNWMAGLLGITKEELIAEAKSKMQRRY